MGEAARRRAAAYHLGPWLGGDKRCPTCFGLNVACESVPREVTEGFYGQQLAVCVCGAAWEPIDEAKIFDRDDPTCSTTEPCDNCAFRPGSPEQADTEAWKLTIQSLRGGGVFYCHKGVPIAPGTEDGFAYPKTIDALGRVMKDIAKMRICRGYLNAWGKWNKAARKPLGACDDR